MANKDEIIWNKEKIRNAPPAVKPLIMAYSTKPKKVLLSFKFDSTPYPGCILDRIKPIEINGDRVPIDDLPSDLPRLKYVERSGIDVTNHVRSSPNGESNSITVNYKVRDKPYLFGKFGNKDIAILDLKLNVEWSETRCDKGHEIQAGEGVCRICHPKPADTKYCMWHGETVPGNAKQCPNGGPDFITIIPAKMAKTCPNPSCKKTIHAAQVYCHYCGMKQAMNPNFPPPSTSPQSEQK
jgi:hypothetical protein